MPEIKPDLSNANRCISVHWSLPVQCERSRAHFENWHWATDPITGNRIRYRRTLGIYATEELRDGGWHVLPIPPPEVADVAAQLDEAIADRDRAREVTVALEQENARVRGYAQTLAKSDDPTRAFIGSALLAMVGGEEE